MFQKYDFRKIEKKWQEIWEKTGVYEAADKKRGAENFYTLVEFPYPSGNLHTGHWYAFSVQDIYVRFKRMQGSNVLFPIGFDAFGLPAENAALKRGINPKIWTYVNIKYMRKQLRSMGASFDWSREVITSDPEYYKWTQWLFLQLFKNGLAYQAETAVNWCPQDKTVLANEQVVDNCCERCDAPIEQRKMKQWMLKITDYSERLIDDLEKLNWPEEIKEAQRNWIGRSEGALIKFQATRDKRQVGQIQVFTTRPDTLFGATYMVLAPEHPFIKNFQFSISNFQEVEEYIKKTKRKTELQRQEEAKEKTGVELKGIKAINPATKEEIPIWISDYVLMSYGTGAIMAVPGHDQRDFEFAKKFDLPIKMVVCPHYPEKTCPVLDRAYEGEGHLVGSGKFDGTSSVEAGGKIAEYVGGKRKIQYRLRDWVVSRQRYWGCPIPIIHCQKCGAVPAAEKDLPVKLPPIKDFLPSGDVPQGHLPSGDVPQGHKPVAGGKSPLARVKNFVKTKCPKCKGDAERETDTLDTFVDSSWYFLRYCDSKNNKKFADSKKLNTWMPVDLYSGGAEHTTMHLLYSRFFYKAMYDFGLIPQKLGSEPYRVRRNRGLILGPDGQKMSKSRGNVVDPDKYVCELGADSVRMHLAFIGPYNEVGAYPWSPQGILGVHRFLQRVWKLFIETRDKRQETRDEKLERLLHKTIKKVTEDIESFKFNTAISALMILFNEMEKNKSQLSVASRQLFLRLLNPFAPHIAEELNSHAYRQAGKFPKRAIAKFKEWPLYDPKLIKEDTFMLVIQINGKVRDSVEISVDISKDDAIKLTLGREKVKLHLGSSKPRRIIYVPKRLVNIVV